MSVTAPQRPWPTAELPPRPPRRWGRDLLALLVLAGAVTLVVANWHGGREGAAPAATPVPFAPEPHSFPRAVEDDYAIAVDAGVPTPAFRSTAEGIAAAIRDDDIAALSRFQLSGTEQPNLLAGLLELYGGRVVTPAVYQDSGFAELGDATVYYEVQCGGGVTVVPLLHFQRYDGDWYLFPLGNDRLGASDPAWYSTEPAAVSRAMTSGQDRYPACP